MNSWNKEISHFLEFILNIKVRFVYILLQYARISYTSFAFIYTYSTTISISTSSTLLLCMYFYLLFTSILYSST